jgi:Protein of unknown function (DUF3563)
MLIPGARWRSPKGTAPARYLVAGYKAHRMRFEAAIRRQRNVFLGKLIVRAVRSLADFCMTVFRRWWRHRDIDERYLATATDLADLERRIRGLERDRGRPVFVTFNH